MGLRRLGCVYGYGINAATGLVVLAVVRILRASAITTMLVARNGGERRPRRDKY